MAPLDILSVCVHHDTMTKQNLQNAFHNYATIITSENELYSTLRVYDVHFSNNITFKNKLCSYYE